MEPHRPEFVRNDHPIVRKRCLDLRRVKATEQLKVTVLSPWIQGYDCHWVNGHTEPCTKKHGECSRCDQQLPYKWIGFLHCAAQGEKFTFFLELTDHAYQSAVNEKGTIPTFRGLQMCFLRERGKINSPVRAVLLSPEPVSNDRLPAPKDVEDSLRVAWRQYFRT